MIGFIFDLISRHEFICFNSLEMIFSLIPSAWFFFFFLSLCLKFLVCYLPELGIAPSLHCPAPYQLTSQITLLWKKKSQESMLTALYTRKIRTASIYKVVSGSLGVKYKEKHSNPKVKNLNTRKGMACFFLLIII